MLPRLLSLLLFAATCSGCFLFNSPDDSPPKEAAMETSGQAETGWALEVGQGEGEFASVEDGTHVMKVHGPQGGTHVYVAARLESAHLRDELDKYAYVEVEVTTPTALVSRTVNMMGVTPKDESTIELASLYAYLDENVHGDITVTVKIASEDKTKWASASRHFVVDD